MTPHEIAAHLSTVAVEAASRGETRGIVNLTPELIWAVAETIGQKLRQERMLAKAEARLQAMSATH